MKKIAICMLVALAVYACADPKMEKIEALKTEAIAVHDEVMPRLGEIHDLTGSLKEVKEQLSLDTNVGAEAKNTEILGLIKQLDEADEAMMNWMHEYAVDYEKEHTKDEAIQYYTGQVESIGEVRDLMNTSIHKAQQYVENSQSE